MQPPVIGFLAFTSGSYEGAIIRDMRLANALARRGYKVVVYWMMERNRELVDEGITQRMLCSGLRFQFKRPSGLMRAVLLVLRHCRSMLQSRSNSSSKSGSCCSWTLATLTVTSTSSS